MELEIIRNGLFHRGKIKDCDRIGDLAQNYFLVYSLIWVLVGGNAASSLCGGSSILTIWWASTGKGT